jgi:hypothetical protein
MKSALNQTAFQSLESAKTPQGWQARGAFNTAFDKANNTLIGDILAEHFCCCRGRVLCKFCLGWDRTIRGIDARRSDGLRRKALGDLERGAV